MREDELTRRQLMAASASSFVVTSWRPVSAHGSFARKAGKLAILGGEPVRENRPLPGWPYMNDNVIQSLLKTAKSGIWCRIQSTSGTVPTFEKDYAALLGTRFCVASGPLLATRDEMAEVADAIQEVYESRDQLRSVV